MRRYVIQIALVSMLCGGALLSAHAQALDELSLNTMSGEDKLAAASSARRSLAESAARIEAMKKTAAASEEDPSRIRCLNEASVSVNGFLAVASQSYDQLQSALDAGDRRAENHHLMMVTTSSQRATNIEAQAAQCIGSALRYAGDSQTTQTIDPRLAEYDPMAFDDDSGGAFIFLEELPPKASAER